MWRAIAIGAVLGAASRVEEVHDGFDLGVSTNFTWLATAFLAAALAGATTVARNALAGAATLTAANIGYYAYVLVTEPGRPLVSVAGPVHEWFVLGVAGGLVFGAAGALLRRDSRAWRAASTAPLAALLAAQHTPALAPLLP